MHHVILDDPAAITNVVLPEKPQKHTVGAKNRLGLAEEFLQGRVPQEDPLLLRHSAACDHPVQGALAHELRAELDDEAPPHDGGKGLLDSTWTHKRRTRTLAARKPERRTIDLNDCIVIFAKPKPLTDL